MVDIFTYRQNIGCFNQVCRFRSFKKFNAKKEEYVPMNQRSKIEFLSILFMGLILLSSWKVAHSSMQTLSSGLRRSHLVDFFSGAYLQVSPTNSTNNQINVEQVKRSEFRKKTIQSF